MRKQIKKVLFVIPSYSDNIIDNFTKNSVVVPYGVLSLISYLEYYCDGVKCKILDFNTKNKSENVYDMLKNEVADFKPDMVGLSIMYNACKKYICPFAEVIKGFNQDILIVAGGIMATNMLYDIFNESKLVDAVCYGEGELPLKELIMSQDTDRILNEHPSFIIPNAIKKGKKPVPSFIYNLDDIPPLNYFMIDRTQYFSRISSKDGQDKLTLPIHSTRGCPFDCIFCCSAANHGKKVRYMSAQRFINDVKLLIEKYKITKLSIDDDQFLFDRERAKDILAGLAEFNIELEMANGLTVKFIDDEIALLLKKAGLKIAVLAIESGSQNVLTNIIKKPLNIKQIAPVAEVLKKYGLSIHTFFIIGFPGETDEDRKNTRDLILDIGFDWNGIFIATPYKGSRLYELCLENNYISEEDIANINIYNCKITAPGINPDRITKEAYLLNLDVNFVNNYNYANGLYSKAVKYFDGVVKKYPQHAFAHYFLAKALEQINDADRNLINEHYQNFRKIVEFDKEWNGYAKHFNICREEK